MRIMNEDELLLFIQDEMKRNNIKQTDVAERMLYDKQTVNKWFSGKIKLRIQTMYDLLDMLDCTVYIERKGEGLNGAHRCGAVKAANEIVEEIKKEFPEYSFIAKHIENMEFK